MPLRAVYEIVFFLVVWEIAYDVVAIKRDFIILHQSVLRGVSIEKIVEEQQASGGMWAFSEGLESMFLMVLLYLLWPLCFNVVAWLIKTRVQSLRVD